MTAFDQISRMQSQGLSSDQIANQLRSQGISEQEIANALSQSQIKQAVTGQNILGQGPPMGMDPINPVPPNQFPGGAQAPQQFDGNPQGFGMQNDALFGQTRGQEMYGGQAPQQESGAYSAQSGDPYGAMAEGSGEYAGMQPSLISQGQVGQGQGEYARVGQQYAGGGMQDYGADAYSSMYQPYQEAISSDVITEISEQVVNERLSALQEKINKILDMRTVVEANMTNLNDRLKRMERIVDQMQVSILKKVGEYMTDIQDVKKELEETQKSFVSIQKTKSKK